MTPDELAQEIQLHGHATRVRGHEVLFKTCLFCTNTRWNLEVSAPKGVYHCWACGASGTATALLRAIGSRVDIDVQWTAPDDATRTPGQQWPTGTVPVTSQPSAQHFLMTRGVNGAEASWLNVGVSLTGSWAPRLIFPLEEYWHGAPMGHVSRSYTGDGPKYTTDVVPDQSLPGWRGVSAVHVLVEGVFDALAVRRAGYGAAMLLGKGYTEATIAWACQARPQDEIVVMLDADAHERARSLYWRIRNVHSAVGLATLPTGMDPGAMSTQEINERLRAATGEIVA